MFDAVEDLLSPVSMEALAGRDLEYTPEYVAFERLSQPKPPRSAGRFVLPEEAPDFDAIIRSAVALLMSGKDLRVAVQLARALLKREGFAGFAGGLAVVRGLIERYWTTLYPCFDEEGDPTIRVNAMAALTNREALRAVRSAPLAVFRAARPVTIQDLDPTRARSRAATSPTQDWGDVFDPDIPLGVIEAALNDVEACVQEVRALEKVWRARLEETGWGEATGVGTSDSLATLHELLADTAWILRQHAKSLVELTLTPATEAELDGTGPSSLAVGEFASTADVLRALDSICRYFARHEPSSLVPIILERCKRLVAGSDGAGREPESAAGEG